MKKIDLKGLNCPEPVIKTKKELDEMNTGETIEVIVDNPAAWENVTRLAESQGAKAVRSISGKDHIITITKGEPAQDSTECAVTPHQKANVMFIKSACIGNGDDELGAILSRSFFNTLSEYETPPKKLIFVNGGVKLTTEGSDIIDALQTLENRGTEIFSCGTCLDFYGLKEKLKAGKIGNMYDIVDSLVSEKVVFL